MNPRFLKKYLKELDAGQTDGESLSLSIIYKMIFSNFYFNFHAVKEFLEKCKSEFEEAWSHPKHVSFNFFIFQFKTFLIRPRKTLRRNGPKILK